MFNHPRLTYASAMSTRTAVWALLAVDISWLAEFAARGDRVLRPEEFVPTQATTERQLGRILPDRSPERRN